MPHNYLITDADYGNNDLIGSKGENLHKLLNMGFNIGCSGPDRFACCSPS